MRKTAPVAGTKKPDEVIICLLYRERGNFGVVTAAWLAVLTSSNYRLQPVLCRKGYSRHEPKDAKWPSRELFLSLNQMQPAVT